MRCGFPRQGYFDGATFVGLMVKQRLIRMCVSIPLLSRGKRILKPYLPSNALVNAKMKEETSFEGAIFKTEPPQFFGAKLHQGTVWRGITWPPTPKGKDEAGAFVDAYACLKLEMDRLKKHEDELKFFSLELRSLRILRESKFRGSGIPIALYGIICDYGRSYIRPLIGLFVVAAIGALIFLPFKILSPWAIPWSQFRKYL